MAVLDAGSLRRLVHRLRARLRPPRRLRLRRSGGFLILGTFGLGFATLNTGNNLLYLLLGALLGTIALSGWLSERALRDVRVRRVMPRAITAGTPASIGYTLHNAKQRLPSHGLLVRELTHGGAGAPPAVRVDAAFVATLEPGATARVRAPLDAARRGVYGLHGVTIATAFPFGLFDKERDLLLPGSLTVWPRTDRPVRPPRVGGRTGSRQRAGAGAAAGAERGDYRGLREYRPGDDPRDIHWRSTARRGEPIVRQYDRDVSDEYWIVLDTVAPAAALGEAAVEVAAALIVAAGARGDRFGLAAGTARIPPGAATGRVEAGLDVLAAVRLAARGAAPALPAPPAACVLVTARGGGAAAWGDIYVAGEEPTP